MNTLPLRRRAAMSLATLALAGGCLSLMPAAPQSAMRWITDICSAAGRPMFSSAPTPAGAPALPATNSRILSCESLPDVPGKAVTTVAVDFPPLAASAPHRHPGTVTAVVVQGTIRSQLAGGPLIDYKTGETFFEPPRALHLVAENPDPSHPAKLIAYFVTDENCGPLVLPVD